MPCFSFVYRTAHWPRNSYVNSVPTQRRTAYHKHILYTRFRSTHFSHNLWNTYTNVNTNISTVSLYSPLFFCRMPQKVSLSAAKTHHAITGMGELVSHLPSTDDRVYTKLFSLSTVAYTQSAVLHQHTTTTSADSHLFLRNDWFLHPFSPSSGFPDIRL